MSDHAEAESEIRELFRRWFAASAAKDIDGAMSPIATDVVSYEHTDRLQHVGIDAVRAICQTGFDAMQGTFMWDVPDLHVVVTEDEAVTWGMNRIRQIDESGTERLHFSRGTRVFRRLDGAWRMIHQHVSYPLDPATGMAQTDLTP